MLYGWLNRSISLITNGRVKYSRDVATPDGLAASTNYYTVATYDLVRELAGERVQAATADVPSVKVRLAEAPVDDAE
jgi:hypothetical protein